MNIFKKFMRLCLAGVLIAVLSGCAPEVGSEKWCADMKEKPKTDWSASEAADFTKHCILK